MAHSKQLSAAQIQDRREALLAAERSGMMDGLPPASQLARDLGERWAIGEITIDEAVAGITRHYLTQPEDPTDSK